MKHHPCLARFSRRACIALIGILMLAAVTVGAAQAQEPTDTPNEPTAETSNTCVKCHADLGDHWSSSTHANAYSDPVFQAQWEEANQDPDCLDCHTTGYSPATETYDAEGVTCVACHGEVPDSHPKEPVDATLANESCASCHTVTKAELRASQHEVVGLECTSCHTPHDNGLRRETENEQCLSCHGLDLEGFIAHETHIANDVSCRDCHGYSRPESIVAGADGQAPTGHDFQVAVTACVDCHEGVDLSAEVPRGGGESLIETSGQRAELRVKQLEAALETQVVAQRNQTVMNIVKGGLGGLLAGSVVVWLIARRTRNGLPIVNGGSHDDK